MYLIFCNWNCAHALIAAMNKITVEAVRIFGEAYTEVNLMALVDFENNVIKTSLECAEALKDKLWGVRVDTADYLVDKSLFQGNGNFQTYRY